MTNQADPEILFAARLPEIGAEGRESRYHWQVDAERCSSLAVRFGCVEIPTFEVKAMITPLRKEGYFRVNGAISARVVQNCVVSLEPVVSDLEKQFELLLVPETEDDPPDPELDDQELETYSGHSVDLGEIGAVELALALDPYPRAPGVSVTDLGPGGSDTGYEVSEDGHIKRNRPFEALAALKRKG